MKEYAFYGWQDAGVQPAVEEWKKVGDPRKMYDLLEKCWDADTCAPRMRSDWTQENQTLGQCSITAFLAQDVYGGKVYGVPLGDGNFHCFNDVDGTVFDLTSEQFGDRELDYEHVTEQFREVHFAKAEKNARYECLKERLKAAIAE